MMRNARTVLALLALGLVAMGALVPVSGVPLSSDPAGTVVYTSPTQHGTLLYTNLTGVERATAVVVFDGPVAIIEDETYLFGGGAVSSTRDVLENGRVWYLAFDGLVPGGTLQLGFAPVGESAGVREVLLGAIVRSDPGGTVVVGADGSTSLFYVNDTGVERGSAALVFDKPVAVVKDEVRMLTGGIVAAATDVLGNGRVWQLAFDTLAAGGTLQLGFAAVKAPAGVEVVFLGGTVRSDPGGAVLVQADGSTALLYEQHEGDEDLAILSEHPLAISGQGVRAYGGGNYDSFETLGGGRFWLLRSNRADPVPAGATVLVGFASAAGKTVPAQLDLVTTASSEDLPRLPLRMITLAEGGTILLYVNKTSSPVDSVILMFKEFAFVDVTRTWLPDGTIPEAHAISGSLKFWRVTVPEARSLGAVSVWLDPAMAPAPYRILEGQWDPQVAGMWYNIEPPAGRAVVRDDGSGMLVYENVRAIPQNTLTVNFSLAVVVDQAQVVIRHAGPLGETKELGGGTTWRGMIAPPALGLQGTIWEIPFTSKGLPAVVVNAILGSR